MSNPEIHDPIRELFEDMLGHLAEQHPEVYGYALEVASEALNAVGHLDGETIYLHNADELWHAAELAYGGIADASKERDGVERHLGKDLAMLGVLIFLSYAAERVDVVLPGSTPHLTGPTATISNN
jgi:hypothetical protein